MAAFAIAGGIVAILGGGGLIGWWRATKPGRERNAAVADAILGKAAVYDRAGGTIEKKQFGLVERTETLEVGFAAIANQDERIKKLEAGHAEHDAAIAAILAGTYLAGSEAALRAAEQARKPVVPGETE